ncbi:MAG TPA: hypothetical protein VKP11_05370, partial [Frankiaceae bacterium]|nr:hypothetical protein [Frankiaceae bacterium]
MLRLRLIPLGLAALVASRGMAASGQSMHRWVRVPLQLPSGSAPGARCRSLRPADVDGDGIQDLVATCDGTPTGYVAWRGNAASLFPERFGNRPAEPVLPPESVDAAAAARPAPIMGGVTPETRAAALARLVADGYVPSEPPEAVALRLNEDALPDLALVEPGASAPTVFATAPLSTYVVDSTGDGTDAIPGDNVCADATGHCTLRAAIIEANAHGGADTIEFNIGSGIPTIPLPSTVLPAIGTPVTINGATGGATRVDIVRTGSFTGNGLRLASASAGS